ncbi:MAG: SPOR domain-containing protein [Crocinitomicaceae bacterium]|nr:SPOR domain-containing protein [Crocinitomicaceae bacterium]
MDQYLIQILKETNTIIIPDLGALTITSEEQNEIMLMPFLKHDDGKLANHIAEKEGIDGVEAKNIVAKHVREIKAKLDQGDTYVIFELGTFSKGNDGEIQFTNWKASSMNVAGVEKVKKEEIKLPSEDKPTEIGVPKISSTVHSMNNRTGVPRKEMNVAEKEELSKSVDKLNDLKKQQKKNESKRKVRPVFYIILFIFIVLTAGGTYVFINYENIKEHVPFLSTIRPSTKASVDGGDTKKDNALMDEVGERNVEDEVSELEEEIKKNDVVPDTIEEEPLIDTPFKPFHIIAGAFGAKQNAMRLTEKIKEMGYPCTTFERGKMTMVCVQSFETNAEALSAIISIKEDVPAAWILKWL